MGATTGEAYGRDRRGDSECRAPCARRPLEPGQRRGEALQEEGSRGLLQGFLDFCKFSKEFGFRVFRGFLNFFKESFKGFGFRVYRGGS